MSWLSRLFGAGGGADYQTELYGVDVDNKAIEQREAIVTICLAAQIEDGKRLGFRVSPKLANQGKGNTRNPLAVIRDELKADLDQRAVVCSVTRLHAHNELGVDVCFELQHPFEHDAATDLVRKRVAAAVQADASHGTTLVSRRGAPGGVPNVMANGVANGVVNDNNASMHLAQPTDTEDFAGLLTDAEDGKGAGQDAFAGMSARQKLDRINRITLRGGQHRSNEAECSNVINLGIIRAMSTTIKQEQVYRASLSDDSIKWFAGQDDVVADKTGAYQTGPKMPPQPARPLVEGTPATRAAMPAIPYVIMDADSALVTFIKRFCDDMPNIHERMQPVRTDRAENGIRYYKVDKPLVEEAKEKILYTVYAQMYYTRLQDCLIARRVESETCEESIALKVAADWGLPVDPKTKRIADWSADAYRPLVVITLRVAYTVASGVSATAASLFKTKTRLVPANK